MGQKYTSQIFILIALTIFFVCCHKEEGPPDPVTDFEGNSYKTVKIGTQIWMAENLKATLFNDGTEIPLVSEASAWSKLITPGYCWYENNEPEHKDTYGALYNGYTVSTGDLCPAGWHVPEKEEWQEMIEFLTDSITGGGKLKEAGTTHWQSPNKGADNSTGFTAFGSGIRYFEGSFRSILSFTSFWAATETGSNNEWYLSLFYADATATMDHRSKKHGFSVRCIKDSQNQEYPDDK